MFIAFAGYCLLAITNSVSYPVLCLNDFVCFDNPQKNEIVRFFPFLERNFKIDWIYIFPVWCLAFVCVNHKIIHRMWNLFPFQFLKQIIIKPMEKQIPNVFFTIKFRFHQISVLASFFSLSFHTHIHILLYAISFYNIPDDWLRSPEPRTEIEEEWQMENEVKNRKSSNVIFIEPSLRPVPRLPTKQKIKISGIFPQWNFCSCNFWRDRTIRLLIRIQSYQRMQWWRFTSRMIIIYSLRHSAFLYFLILFEFQV